MWFIFIASPTIERVSTTTSPRHSNIGIASLKTPPRPNTSDGMLRHHISPSLIQSPPPSQQTSFSQDASSMGVSKNPNMLSTLDMSIMSAWQDKFKESVTLDMSKYQSDPNHTSASI